MSKQQMAAALAKMLARGDRVEEARLYRHHMSRTVAQVRESYSRQVAVAGTTRGEINRNCQFAGLARLGK
jgi:hypothetical protein